MIATKPGRTTKPLLLAYLLVVGFLAGLLVNRSPEAGYPVVAVDRPLSATGGVPDPERERPEPPLWLQLFRPSLPTARVMLRAGLPFLSLLDGSAREVENRSLLVYLAKDAQPRPQTLFQAVLPFLRHLPDQPPGLSGTDGAVVPEFPPATPPAQEEGPAPEEERRTPVAGGQPLVGIYHTHDWESYISEFPTLKVEKPEDLLQIQSEDHTRRTVKDLGLNLALRLKEQGITTVYADATHQRLGYNYAYTASRETARQILREHPSVKILLDIHRDGAWGLDTTTMVRGQRVAQVRCIIGRNQPRWEENKAFCDRLMERLDQMYPGMALPTRVQEDRYNQDLLPGAILLEIGGALNHFDEADRAVTYLSEALAALIREGAYPR
ncbi:MAG TPA: stage II sporulation protein P [Symbiobacteriaceae bacterium]